MAVPTTELARMGQYNAGFYNAGTNPFGMDGYGYTTNLPLLASDAAVVANYLATDLAPLAGMAEEVGEIAGIATEIDLLAGQSASITTLAALSTQLAALAGIAANITAVAGNAVNINTVAGGAANITSVAGAVVNINTVAGALTNIASVVANQANINTVAARGTDIALLADIQDGTIATGAITAAVALATPITNVANNAADISAVADALAPINTVAGIEDDVQAVGGSIADVSAVATNIADVSTVADNIAAIIAAPDAAAAAQTYADAAKHVSRFVEFDSSTADSDPGNGAFRFSFDIAASTPGDTGFLYIDLMDSSGTTITTWIEGWDDVLNDISRGEVTLVKATSPGTNATVRVVGAVVSATGYRKVPVAVLARGGTWTDADEFSIEFNASGADGADGAGAGNVNPTGTITSGRLAQFADGAGNVIEDSGVAISGLFQKSADDLDDITEGATNKHFTSTLKAKLDGVEASADVTTAAKVGAVLAGSTAKATPVDNDGLWLTDSASSNAPKRTLWSSLKATLKTYFDTLYSTVSHVHTFASLTSKPTTLAGYGIEDGGVVYLDIASASAAVVSRTALEVRTSFFAVANGKGGAKYKRVASEPTHAGKFRSADRWLPSGLSDSGNGGWWEIAEPAISWTALGAIGNGVADDTLPIRAAISVAHSLIRPCHGPSGDYVVTDTLVNDDRPGLILTGDGGANTRVLHRAVGKPLFQKVGDLVALVSGESLTAAAQRNATTITVSSTASYSVGQYFVLQDPSQPVINYQDGSTISDTGQVCQVREVVDGTTLKLWTALEFDYTTATKLRRITKLIKGFTAKGLHFVNEMKGSLGTGTTCFSMFRVHDLDITDVWFTGLDEDAIRLDLVIDFHIEGVKGFDINNATGATPYLIAAGFGSTNGIVRGCFMRGGRHLFTTLAASGRIEPSHITVSDSIGIGSEGAVFDTHPGSREIHFHNCWGSAGAHYSDVASTGYALQIRGRRSSATNCGGSGLKMGASLVYGEDNHIVGGDFNACDIAINISNSPRSSAKGVRIRDPITNAVVVTKSGGIATMADVSVTDITVSGNPSGAAFNFAHWDDTYQVANLQAKDATTLQSGIPHPFLYGFGGLGTVKIC